jgi:2-polyprenyl-3-methyl-5-hydroxy-6-metoxy-1,4-benzoquinol methylase
MSIDTKDQAKLHQARQVQLDRSAHYIEDFLRQTSPEKDYDQIRCPTCDQTATRPLFTKNNGNYCHCPNCDHIYLSNPLKQDQLINFYTGYPSSSLDWHRSESEFYKIIYEKGLDMINQSKLEGTILDIGCSGGYFLSIASKRGLDVYGVEPNKVESEYAVDQGISILGQTIDDLPSDKEFDIITLWDVLEHIREPVSYLKRLRTHLNSTGLVFVQIPTCDSLAARVMRGACNMFDGIEHLTLFSAHSLDMAFTKAGYKIVKRQSVISELYALQNYLSYQINPYLSHTQTSFSVDYLTADTIEAAGHGYKIQALYSIKS